MIGNTINEIAFFRIVSYYQSRIMFEQFLLRNILFDKSIFSDRGSRRLCAENIHKISDFENHQCSLCEILSKNLHTISVL